MDTYSVEVVLFLKANGDHVPALRDIPSIAIQDVRTHIPARVTGNDEDLVAAEAAEAAFDAISNSQVPIVDSVD